MCTDMQTGVQLWFNEVSEMAKNDSRTNTENLEKPSYELSSSTPLS
jgi:hypothetical protein